MCETLTFTYKYQSQQIKIPRSALFNKGIIYNCVDSRDGGGKKTLIHPASQTDQLNVHSSWDLASRLGFKLCDWSYWVILACKPRLFKAIYDVSFFKTKCILTENLGTNNYMKPL